MTWPTLPAPVDPSRGGDDTDEEDEFAFTASQEETLMQEYLRVDSSHKRRDNFELGLDSLEPSSTTAFTIRGQSQALAARGTASGSSSLPEVPTYTGSVAFPTTLRDVENISSAWLATAAHGTPTGSLITQAPASTPQCTFQEANPDEGVDQGGCKCTSNGQTTLWPMLSFTASGTKTAWGTADYCAYTTIPGNPKAITTDVASWTSNCQACTLTGGIADAPTCTQVQSCTPTTPVPTFAAYVANRKLDIGDAHGTDNGTALAKDMFKQLSSFCTGGTSNTCDTSKFAKLSDVETVLDGNEEPLKPQMYWENAVFSDMKVLEEMLSAGLSSWIAASNKMCREVEYKADEPVLATGCGSGPLTMRRSDNTTMVITNYAAELSKRCGNDCTHTEPTCLYKAWICDAPDLISEYLLPARRSRPSLLMMPLQRSSSQTERIRTRTRSTSASTMVNEMCLTNICAK